MQDTGRWLIVCGLAIAMVGAVVWLLGHLGFRGMPGDIRYSSGRLRVYFPIVSCVVLSLILSALLWLWRWFDSK